MLTVQCTLKVLQNYKFTRYYFWRYTNCSSAHFLLRPNDGHCTNNIAHHHSHA